MSYTLAINMAMTLDGKVVRPDGKWYGLSSRKDKARMDVYRSEAEILIVGKNSILNDNPVIRLRYAEGEAPIPVILLRKGTIPQEKRIFHTGKKPILYCTSENFMENSKLLDNLAEIIQIGESDISVEMVLQNLLQKGFTRILLEGGPTLNAIFFQKDLVNRIYLTIVPYIIGQNDLAGIVNDKNPISHFDSKKWKLVRSESIENEIFLMYERNW